MKTLPTLACALAIFGACRSADTQRDGMITPPQRLTPDALHGLLPSLNQPARDHLVRRLCSDDSNGVISAEAVQAVLALQKGVAVEQLMVDLVPVAQIYAQPTVSGYRVGAVGRGNTGALYLGANLEIPGENLVFTLHAEQSVILRALHHSETSLTQLSVSAPPCGSCRQFLNELSCAAELKIIVAEQPDMLLTALLPYAFGPRNLGVKGALLAHAPQSLTCDRESVDHLVHATCVAATRSYCPYTDSPSAVGIELTSGRTTAATYVENAAYNPSVSPILSVLNELRFVNPNNYAISRVVLVERKGAKISQARTTSTIMHACRIGCALETVPVE